MIWLSISLFCNKSQWNKLIVNGITPFVANDFKDAYTIAFNYTNGDNIQLSLLTDELSAPLVAKKVNDFFSNYFSNSYHLAQDINLPMDGVFMHFTTNAVRYGLYPPCKIHPQEKIKYSLSIELSQLILDVLKDEDIDDEIIFTFSTYLQIGLIKVLESFHPGFTSRFRPLVLKDLNQTHTSDTNILRAQLESNKHFFIEIINDINAKENNPLWFKNWLNICEIEINKTYAVKSAETIYQQMLREIHKHLGVPPRMQTVLSFFIEQILLYRNQIVEPHKILPLF